MQGFKTIQLQKKKCEISEFRPILEKKIAKQTAMDYQKPMKITFGNKTH